MKLRKLIIELQKLERKLPLKCNPEVVVDFDENGYYSLEKVSLEVDDEETVINLKSSNEA